MQGAGQKLLTCGRVPVAGKGFGQEAQKVRHAWRREGCDFDLGAGLPRFLVVRGYVEVG
jgi:hypothetical protein